MYGVDGVRNVKPDRWLDEGDKVTVAGHEFEIFIAPDIRQGRSSFSTGGRDLRWSAT